MKKNQPDEAAKAVPAPAAYIRLMFRHFGTTDDLRRRLLAGTDIDAERLMRAGAEVTLFSYLTFSANLVDAIGEDWPLQCPAIWGTQTQGALEVAARSAPTIGEGIAVLARFGHVRGPHMALSLKRDKKATALTITPTAPIPDRVMRPMIATAYLSGKAMMDAVLEDDRAGIIYRFTGPPPKHADRLRAALGGRVEFNRPHGEIVIENALCDRPSPYADASLFATAVAELEQAASRIRTEDTLVLKIERLLKRRRTGRVTEEEAAEELRLSRRTLVRRLSASGTSFRTLLDAHLRSRAEHMLKDGRLSRDDMAEALGFEDPTSFSRACRRWFSRTKKRD
ncbi:MAG: AraC family transcriptional regulator ligand-binding domain-containing protein [Alphaproteobacteria bacterium]|nr:AraC family transcriptional regulator ligand-binding domain-containing protein [Alphaproteobacteria bacterium]